MRRPRPRASQARRPGRHGDRPGGTTTLTRFVRYRDDSHAQRQCWKRAVSGSAAPETVNRRAERRWAQRPFAKGARTPAKACTLQVAPIGAPPLDLRGQTPAVLRRGTRDGHPRGRPKAAADFAWLFDIVNRILNPERASAALPSPIGRGWRASQTSLRSLRKLDCAR